MNPPVIEEKLSCVFLFLDSARSSLALLVGQGLDPDRNAFSTPNSEWPVIDVFQSGQVVEIDLTTVFYHWVSVSVGPRVRLCNINPLLL